MISAVVLTKNEEENIKKCLSSLSFCEEIIVIDDNSKDKTREIAKDMGAEVYTRSLDNNFAEQRNFGLNKTKKRWVLFIDADEMVSKKFAEEIVKILKEAPLQTGFLIERRDFLWGHEFKYGEVGRKSLLRLARRGAGKWRRAVHEVWEIRGKTGKLKNHLHHYPHQSLAEFIANINRFSTLHAEANLKDGKRSSVFKIVVWPVGHFFYNFVLKGGFLDGISGFVLALVMSFHSFLSWSKLFLLQKTKVNL